MEFWHSSLEGSLRFLLIALCDGFLNLANVGPDAVCARAISLLRRSD